ncbi:MAG: uracil phosphoribosyltransferase [Bacteroidetes bacterium]|nr:uracil phosphoribosyltransferase [Bacteroidota bacterium]
MVTVFNTHNTILNNYIAEMRDVSIQKDALRFRKNIERIGQLMAYEISKKITYSSAQITTPLGLAKENVIAEQPVLATILRAGLPFHYGMLSVFDKAENAFITAFRKYSSETEFSVEIQYMACPDLTGKTLILCDPMLASGSSMFGVYEKMLKNGKPAKVHIASIIASQKAVDFVSSKFGTDVDIWIGAVDKELNSHSYIVPGLGDAGDLAFGEKL